MDIINKINTLINNGVVPHAVIFEGENANLAADHFSRCVVCSGNEKPCDKCNNCIKANNSNHPDIKYYYPKGALKAFPIETIREIRADAFITPNEANKKVYILQDVDAISTQSQNALLKILEEPPSFAVFVLTCGQKSSLLDTVLSRAFIFTSNDYDERVQIDDKVAQTAQNIALAILNINELEILKLTFDLNSDKEQLKSVLSELKDIFRQVYIIKLGVLSNNITARKLCESLTVENALNLINSVGEIESAIKKNANGTLNITRMAALLRNAAGR